jgi:hypothetical protein
VGHFKADLLNEYINAGAQNLWKFHTFQVQKLKKITQNEVNIALLGPSLRPGLKQNIVMHNLWSSSNWKTCDLDSPNLLIFVIW